ncbi:Hypothetical predicted protein, partial [Drosophila guanche]
GSSDAILEDVMGMLRLIDEGMQKLMNEADDQELELLLSNEKYIWAVTWSLWLLVPAIIALFEVIFCKVLAIALCADTQSFLLGVYSYGEILRINPFLDWISKLALFTTYWHASLIDESARQRRHHLSLLENVALSVALNVFCYIVLFNGYKRFLLYHPRTLHSGYPPATSTPQPRLLIVLGALDARNLCVWQGKR